MHNKQFKNNMIFSIQTIQYEDTVNILVVSLTTDSLKKII